MRREWIWAGVAAAWVGGLSPAHGRTVGGIELSDTVVVERHPLVLNGAARQRVFIFELYTLGLYLERPTRDPSEVIRSDQVKRIQLHVLHDLPRAMVAKALRHGFERAVTPDELQVLEDRLMVLLSGLRDVKAREQLILTYVPGRGTIVQDAYSTRAIIPGKDFADALFSIWLGPKTDVPHVRTELLGG